MFGTKDYTQPRDYPSASSLCGARAGRDSLLTRQLLQVARKNRLAASWRLLARLEAGSSRSSFDFRADPVVEPPDVEIHMSAGDWGDYKS